ncbi:MAG: allantoicase [Actinomycetales bacterium]
MSNDITDAPAGSASYSAGFRSLPDLAVRSLGGSVVWANDEAFAERENLIKPEPPTHDTSTFGHKGKVYDGWETRRRREPGYDEALIRLGAPGTIHGVVVDTAFFKGNYPPEVSVDAASFPGYPTVAELRESDAWTPIVPRSKAEGHTENVYETTPGRRWTHVRLRMFPDGGIARLRVHGEAVPDPELLEAGAVDLAALENGGRVVGCSNLFYSSPNNLISPGQARSMGEGWETARRRDDGNDWVTVRLAAAGLVRMAELDTSYFKGNAPGEASLSGFDALTHPGAGDIEDPDLWFDLMPRRPLQPDTRHRFLVKNAPRATHVRLDVFPDGGMARVRLWGELAPEGRADLVRRWQDSERDVGRVEDVGGVDGVAGRPADG